MKLTTVDKQLSEATSINLSDNYFNITNELNYKNNEGQNKNEIEFKKTNEFRTSDFAAVEVGRHDTPTMKFLYNNEI